MAGFGQEPSFMVKTFCLTANHVKNKATGTLVTNAALKPEEKCVKA